MKPLDKVNFPCVITKVLYDVIVVCLITSTLMITYICYITCDIDIHNIDNITYITYII